ncbi:MAG TPA: cytochrome c3 family protein, partial [Vicinamibacteria bacterium]|nr:cytochrome c3 family protein [Vicinamibacteria bacterium]
SVEVAASAGMPPTKTCMNCHSQIWSQSPMLEPVRESFRSDKPIEWVRVHDLPDFAYFQHASHVNKGIGCATCHGRVDQMPLMSQHSSLQMEWCLECHRDPARFIRPRDQVFNLAWEPDQNHDGGRLVQEYQVKASTSCSTCHR